MSPKDRLALDACHAHFLQYGRDISVAHVGCGIATNAYLAARRIGKVPNWVSRGSMAHAAARAGVKHYRQSTKAS